MKTLLFFLVFLAPIFADEDEDEDCDFPEVVDRSRLRDEADWPTKNDDPFVDSFKN